jgi:hypothetical protein
MADHEKIKTCFAQIIVNNSEDKPYYSIMYWENGEMNIGFSSYKLDYVRRWLNEEFEVKRNVDVVPVVHGKWIRPHWKNSDYCCDCSECDGETMHREYQWNKKGIYPICPNCGAKMDGGADND